MAVPKRRQSKSRSAIRRAQVMKKAGAELRSLPALRRTEADAPDVRGLRLLPRPAGDRAEGRGAGLRRRPLLPMPRIAVDAMGSDAAPRVEVEGVLAAVRAQRRAGRSSSVTSRACAPSWPRWARAREDSIVVRHAPDVITMHDSPSMAVKQKKQSSMRVCFDLVKAGEADAVVSAGNSGAMMACGLFVLGRLPGVERPGHRHHLPDQGRRVRAARHGRQRRSQADACWRSSRCWARSTRACCTARRGRGWACCRTAPRSTRGRR